MLRDAFTKDLLTEAHKGGLVDLGKYYPWIRWTSIVTFWVLSPASFFAGYRYSDGWFLTAFAMALVGLIGYRILPTNRIWLQSIVTIAGALWVLFCLAAYVGSFTY